MLFIFSCSSEENTIDNIVNLPPESRPKVLEFNSNLKPGASIGFIEATDPENDVLTYTITEGESFFLLDSKTGEVFFKGFDIEDKIIKEEYSLLISITDNENTITNELKINVNIVSTPCEKIDEPEKDRLSNLFVDLSIGNRTEDIIIRWGDEAKIKIYLNGSFKKEDLATIDKFIKTYNEMSKNSSSMLIVDQKEDSNLEIYLETYDVIKQVRPDFPLPPSANGIRGFAYTFRSSKVIFKSTIWLNKINYEQSTIMHEFIHSLGYAGHSSDESSVIHSPSKTDILSSDDLFLIKSITNSKIKVRSTKEEAISNLLNDILDCK